MWDSWHGYYGPINPNGIFLIEQSLFFIDNIVEALQRCTWDLMYDDGTTYYDKCMYMRFMLHLLGDIHQPLHATNFFNASYLPPVGDNSGHNQYMNISQMGPVYNYFVGWNKTISWHYLWDSGVLNL